MCSFNSFLTIRIMESIKELQELEAKKDYLGVIQGVKKLIAEDKKYFTDPYIKEWCGKRWRNLFLQELKKDRRATKKASKLIKDDRPVVQRLAERFLKGNELLEWQVEMPKAQMENIENTTLVFAPGLLTGMLPVRAFEKEFVKIEEKFGWKILRSDSHPMRGCDANTQDLKNALDKGLGLRANKEIISEDSATPPKDVFFIGYSKGAPDVLEFLAKNPEYKDRVRCVFNWAGAVGGSFTASEIDKIVEKYDIASATDFLDRILYVMAPSLRLKGTLRRLEEFDVKGAIRDLTTWKREEFIEENKETLDSLGIPFFNITGATTALEVPY
ncbi:MAG: hypothetical protein ACI86H_001205, partial [bacterium]